MTSSWKFSKKKKITLRRQSQSAYLIRIPSDGYDVVYPIVDKQSGLPIGYAESKGYHSEFHQGYLGKSTSRFLQFLPFKKLFQLSFPEILLIRKFTVKCVARLHGTSGKIVVWWKISGRFRGCFENAFIKGINMSPQPYNGQPLDQVWCRLSIKGLEVASPDYQVGQVFFSPYIWSS